MYVITNIPKSIRKTKCWCCLI